MAKPETLSRAHAILASFMPVLASVDVTTPPGVQALGDALAHFGPFERAGFVLTAATSARAQVYMQAIGSNSPCPTAWGQEVTWPGAQPLAPLANDEARVVRAGDDAAGPAATILTEGNERALLVPLRDGSARPGWLVVTWGRADSEPSVDDCAALDTLGYVLGPAVQRARNGSTASDSATTTMLRALSPVHLRQIAVAGRLASLGTLAGGVVHEINNPATFIALAAGQIDKRMLAAQSGTDESWSAQLLELTAGIQDATKQIRGLVGDFRQFVQGTGRSPTLTVDVERVLLAATDLTKAAHRHDAVLETDIQPIPLCPGRLLVLGPATVNVLVNGIESLGDGPGNRRVRLTASATGQALEIAIADTGGGIPRELLPRVFEPFFTTKSPDIHAGIGLTVARDAVESLGGSIRVISEVGSGTTVTMTVPLPG